ncbi:MAG: SH3 domain-containing protein [bacterium]|jgi:uncharacterized protein YraI|nr:SH3 domain-containing protein [bacterium]
MRKMNPGTKIGIVVTLFLLVFYSNFAPLRAGTIIDTIKDKQKPKESITADLVANQVGKASLRDFMNEYLSKPSTKISWRHLLFPPLYLIEHFMDTYGKYSENLQKMKKEARLRFEIAELYREHLKRMPDQGGWDHYYKKIDKEGWDIDQVEKAILNSQEFAKKHPKPEKPFSGHGTVNATIGLNVRTGPGIGNTKISALPHGAAVTIVGKKDGWYKIEYQGRTAWVCGRYITLGSGQQKPQKPQIPGRIDAPTPQAKSAIDWAYRQMNPATGTAINPSNGKSTAQDPKAWSGWCLGFVSSAYGRAVPNLGAPSAYESYKRFKNSGKIRTGMPIPAGAPLFWAPKGSPWGHVAIYSGRTTASGDPLIINPGSTVKEIPLSQLNKYCGQYLGYGVIP